MLKNHPKGFTVLFFTEIWERFGFYIMSAIYVLYMDKVLGFDDSTKGNLYAIFLGLAYTFPLLGGWLGDKILGQTKTIQIGLFLMIVGYISLALSGANNISMFYAGLFLVAIGTGIFKVNMSVLVGNLYCNNEAMKDAGFNLFYMSVNIGAALGPIAANIIGMITENYTMSFWAAAIGMALAIIIFSRGKERLQKIDILSKEKVKEAVVEVEMTSKEFWQRIVTLVVLFLIASLFWMPFYQNGFALTLFAERSTSIIEWLRPESYVTFNAIFIVVLTPPMLSIFARFRQKDKEPTTPVKIFAGLLIMCFAMLIMVAASLYGGNDDVNIMSPMWLISSYLFITLGEILISPLGQSYVSKVAPPKIQGVMMGGWFSATALGAMSSGIFGKFYSDMSHDQYFLLLAGIVFFAAILVLLFMKKLNRFAK